MNSNDDAYLGLLRIAEMVHSQQKELEELKVKFNAFKGILERIDEMTDSVIEEDTTNE